APARIQKIADTLPSASPASSSAASVLSMVGLSGFDAMAAISVSCAARAASKTGANWSSEILSKAGRPSGPVQFVRGWLARSDMNDSGGLQEMQKAGCT